MRKRTWAIAATAVAALAAAAIPTVNAFAEDTPRTAGHWCDTAEPRPLYELVAADGTGRLYTLNKSEAKQAVSKHKMKLETDPVGYLPCREFTNSIALERLKPKSNSDKWLVTRADGDEADRLEAKGWINEGVSGFAYRDPKGKILLNRYTNGKEWRVAPASEKKALAKKGYKLDGPLGYAYAKAP